MVCFCNFSCRLHNKKIWFLNAFYSFSCVLLILSFRQSAKSRRKQNLFVLWSVCLFKILNKNRKLVWLLKCLKGFFFWFVRLICNCCNNVRKGSKIKQQQHYFNLHHPIIHVCFVKPYDVYECFQSSVLDWSNPGPTEKRYQRRRLPHHFCLAFCLEDWKWSVCHSVQASLFCKVLRDLGMTKLKR